MKKFFLLNSCFFAAFNLLAQRTIPIDFVILEPYNNQVVPNQNHCALSLSITNASITESLASGDTILFTYTGASNLTGIVLHQALAPGQSLRLDTLAGFTNTNPSMNDETGRICVRVLGTANTSLNGSWSNPYSPLEECVTITLKGINSSPCSPTFATISAAACVSYTSPSGRYSWNASGAYKDTLTNAGGCDSILTINLEIGNLDVSVTKNGAVLRANAAGATYQWLDCQKSYAPVAGADKREFTPSVSGEYAVLLRDGSCIDTSACYPVTVAETSLTHHGKSPQINMYPNPTTGLIQIETTIVDSVMIRVSTVTGATVLEEQMKGGKHLLNLTQQPLGIYILQVQMEQGAWTQRISVIQ